MAEMPLHCRCWLMAFSVGWLALTFCLESSVLDQVRGTLHREAPMQRKEDQEAPARSSQHLPASEDLELVTERSRFLEPRDTWMLFLKHSNRGERKRRQKGSVQKVKLHLMHQPPGTRSTDEELLHDLQILVKGMLEQRKKLEVPACDGCRGADEEQGHMPEGGDVMAVTHGPSIDPRPRQRVEAVFHCKLKNDVTVGQGSLHELRPYHWQSKDEPFQRGLGLNLMSGHYTAPSTGFYIFSASILIDHKEDQNGDRQRQGHLKVLICIQSQCLHKMSLKTLATLGINGNPSTVLVSGILFLQSGQYASIFVDNGTGSPLVARCGSEFSGLLLGA